MVSLVWPARMTSCFSSRISTHPSTLRRSTTPSCASSSKARRRFWTTKRRHVVGAGEFLVVTHDMPVVSRITKASQDKPYLALILSLDGDILADLQHAARESPAPDDSDPYALRVGDADIDLVDAFVRYLRALEAPNNTAVLLPLVSREIHYRLLNTPPGHTLRRLSLGNSRPPPCQRRSGSSARTSPRR